MHSWEQDQGQVSLWLKGQPSRLAEDESKRVAEGIKVEDVLPMCRSQVGS